MGVLSLNPGDTVVLKAKCKLSRNSIEAMKEQLHLIICGTDAKVVILEEGMDIGVLREESK